MSDNFVHKILNKLFGRGKSVEMLNGPLTRNEAYRSRYESWRNSDAASRRIHQIATVFWNVYSGIGTSEALHVYKSLPANGFYFNTLLDIPEDEFDFILDEFCDRVIKMDYSVYTSDRKYKEAALGVERIDRHFLKPNTTPLPGGLINQNYGNILLELSFINERPRYLKCLASIFSDRSFAEAQPFEIFAACLFSAD